MTIVDFIQLLCLGILTIIWIGCVCIVITAKGITCTRSDKMKLLGITIFIIIIWYIDVFYLYNNSIMTVIEIIVIMIIMWLTSMGLVTLYVTDPTCMNHEKILLIRNLIMILFLIWIFEIVYLINKI